MLGNCVLVPATYYRIKEKYGDSPCNHCINKQFGCPQKKAIRVGYNSFIPIEDDPKELPKCGIWCRDCKQRNGKIQHEVLWNGRRAYVIKCPVCGSEFLLYKDKVRYEYTGFKNGKGEFIPPDPYGTRRMPSIFGSDKGEPDVLIATFGDDGQSTSTFMDALKRAGIK